MGNELKVMDIKDEFSTYCTMIKFIIEDIKCYTLSYNIKCLYVKLRYILYTILSKL